MFFHFLRMSAAPVRIVSWIFFNLLVSIFSYYPRSPIATGIATVLISHIRATSISKYLYFERIYEALVKVFYFEFLRFVDEGISLASQSHHRVVFMTRNSLLPSITPSLLSPISVNFSVSALNSA